MRARVAVTVLLALCVLSVALAEVRMRKPAVAPDRRKHLAGPPEEFADHVLPDPTAQHQRSEGAYLPVHLGQGKYGSVNGARLVWTREVPVDSSTLFTCSVFSPVPNVEVRFKLPGMEGRALRGRDAFFLGEELLSAENIVKEQSFGLGDAHIPSTTYVFSNPPVGIWTIEVSADALAAEPFLNDTLPEAVLLLDNEAEYEVFTYLHSYNLQQGETVGINALISTRKAGLAAPLRGVVEAADVDFGLPDGKEEVVPMHDDGLGLDRVANDGVLIASTQLTEVGPYRARVELRGRTPQGVDFLRTSQHLFDVVSPDLKLDGQAHVTQNAGDSFLTFQIGVTYDAENAADQTYFVYAEVWGTRADGALVPVAWMGGMSDVAAAGASHALPLQLERDWLVRAQAAAPFTLKNVYVQDRHTHVPLSQRTAVPVQSGRGTPAPQHLAGEVFSGPVTERMRWGPRPAALLNSSNGDGKLMLVHGYCTKAPGPFTRTDFTDYVVFEDYEANRSMDEFAKMLLEFGDSLPAFSIVSHSQGGLASLHLHSFYWSKLEASSGGRLLQSVGSPYRGTALAGSLAGIGDVFGVGCGTHSEMTHDGAALWRSTLPKDLSSHVYYYTSQYSTSGLLHYCNMAANAVLSWPNDGTTEIDYNDLSGGNFMGNKKGWCHSTSMHHPPQCTDADRNREMNAAAAR